MTFNPLLPEDGVYVPNTVYTITIEHPGGPTQFNGFALLPFEGSHPLSTADSNAKTLACTGTDVTKGTGLTHTNVANVVTGITGASPLLVDVKSKRVQMRDGYVDNNLFRNAHIVHMRTCTCTCARIGTGKDNKYNNVDTMQGMHA